MSLRSCIAITLVGHAYAHTDAFGYDVSASSTPGVCDVTLYYGSCKCHAFLFTQWHTHHVHTRLSNSGAQRRRVASLGCTVCSLLTMLPITRAPYDSAEQPPRPILTCVRILAWRASCGAGHISALPEGALVAFTYDGTGDASLGASYNVLTYGTGGANAATTLPFQPTTNIAGTNIDWTASGHPTSNTSAKWTSAELTAAGFDFGRTWIQITPSGHAKKDHVYSIQQATITAVAPGKYRFDYDPAPVGTAPSGTRAASNGNILTKSALSARYKVYSGFDLTDLLVEVTGGCGVVLSGLVTAPALPPTVASPPSAPTNQCPCLTIHPAGITYDSSGNVQLVISGTTYAYHPTYGLHSCEKHDETLAPSCNASPLASWCSDRWCYIDTTNCQLSSTETSHFPGLTSGGTPLAYSYEACGFANPFVLYQQPPSLPPSLPPPPPTSPPTSPSPTSPSPTSPPPSSPTSSSALDAGAIIGISVGSVLVVVCCCVAAVLVWAKQRKKGAKVVDAPIATAS